jgi:hypothetical protein
VTENHRCQKARFRTTRWIWFRIVGNTGVYQRESITYSSPYCTWPKLALLWRTGENIKYSSVCPLNARYWLNCICVVCHNRIPKQRTICACVHVTRPRGKVRSRHRRIALLLQFPINATARRRRCNPAIEQHRCKTATRQNGTTISAGSRLDSIQ